MDVIVLIVGLIIGLPIYFLPGFISNGKANSTAIWMLNLFLGWTLVGWVGALIWAMVSPAQNLDSSGSPIGDTKICPHCAEPVRVAAIKCKHCGSDIEAQTIAKASGFHSDAEEEAMRHYGITFDGTSYHYAGYRCDDLKYALKYAEMQTA